MNAPLPRRTAKRALASWSAIVAVIVAIALGGTWGYRQYLTRAAPEATTSTAPARAPSAPVIGWVDTPSVDAVLGPQLTIAGWALATSGMRSVEIRVAGRTFPATIGLARSDVAAVHPGYADGAQSGFSFIGDFTTELAADPAPQFAITIVAVARDGTEAVLGTRHLISRAAMSRWGPRLERHPALFARKTTFLMMTSGIAAGGADEIDAVYQPYFTRTTQVGFAVPILYMRTTRGASGDWTFDPEFDVRRKCLDRPIADDSLRSVIDQATARNLPVQFILNGGIWADATCDIPEWDLNDHLEQDNANCQWTQRDEVLPDDYTKGLPGSVSASQLARSLTYNIYATTVRQYKRRNLKAAAAIVAEFARAHPELFAGVVLDADTYMNPFVRDGRWYDYNPGMLKQFRHWLRGSGPYAGEGERGAPDLSTYRRKLPLTLADVNRLAHQGWQRWDDVQPPREMPTVVASADSPKGAPRWDDPWYLEWDSFRRHVVALHYDELSAWANEAGIPRDRIYSAQAFIAPDAGRRPVAINIVGPGPDYDSAGVSIEGAIPRRGHLGAILYGAAAENRHPLDNGRSLFATFSRLDPGWGIVEYNAADLKHPQERPSYGETYRTLRDLFNYDGRQIAMMAWNGSNGLFANDPGYVPYTSWRNTPGEDAMRDFLVNHADLPRGARLWTFGTPKHAADDGWTLERGQLSAGNGAIELAFDTSAALLSPPDQVIRPAAIETLIVGLADPARLAGAQVFARNAKGGAWTAVTAPLTASTLARDSAGIAVPLDWPAAYRVPGTIAEQLRIVLTFEAGVKAVRVERIALYPRAP